VFLSVLSAVLLVSRVQGRVVFHILYTVFLFMPFSLTMEAPFIRAFTFLMARFSALFAYHTGCAILGFYQHR
jgi:hypothetical protein